MTVARSVGRSAIAQAADGNGMKPKGDLLTDALHVFVLCYFAIAQPLFDLLSRHAEFFVARRSQPVDVILFIFILCVLLPTLAVLVEVTIGLFGRRIRKGVHGFIVAGLVVGIILPALKQLDGVPGVVLLVVAAMLGGAATVAYRRFPSVWLFLTVLSPALLIFPGLFLFNASVFKVVSGRDNSAVVAAKVNTTTPVVMVVFDELPMVSLMDELRQIDPIRYPNFAVLARNATWFRNATTVSGSTLTAVPAILSGSYPDQSRLPTVAVYPHNLFTLLGGSYEMEVFESHTMLCPEALCRNNRHIQVLVQQMRSMLLDLSAVYLHIILPADLTAGLPVVMQTWQDFWDETEASMAQTPDRNDVLNNARALYNDRARLFTEFVESITATNKPTLYFLHITLPHVPWEYLPSGKRYTEKGMLIPGLNIEKEKWSEDEWLVVQGYQRHLLQVGFVDKLLGDLLTRLKTLNLYDRSLIVVTADHGAGFWPNELRRGLLKTHPKDILGVPLFIKVPHQHEGVTSDRNVKTIDILPTVADILGINLPWSVDGRSIHIAEVICSDGAPIPVIPKALYGHLDGTVIDKDRVRFGGWAADIKAPQIPEAVLIFANGKFLYAGRTEVDRPDVVKAYGAPALQKAGFYYELPLALFRDVDDFGVRLFAVSRNSIASELNYPQRYLWKPKSTRLVDPQGSRTNEQLCHEYPNRSSGVTYSFSTFNSPVGVPLEQAVVEKELLVYGSALAAEQDSLERKLSLFGSGAKREGLFRVGSHSELLGRRVSEVGMRAEAGIMTELDQALLFANVDPEAAFVPAHITGRVIFPTKPLDPLHLAVAVNGTVSAVTQVFGEEGRAARFSAMVPEAAFRAGKNEVEVFIISQGNGSLHLQGTQSKPIYPQEYK